LSIQTTHGVADMRLIAALFPPGLGRPPSAFGTARPPRSGLTSVAEVEPDAELGGSEAGGSAPAVQSSNEIVRKISGVLLAKEIESEEDNELS
jgi:hypothetical protein